MAPAMQSETPRPDDAAGPRPRTSRPPSRPSGRARRRPRSPMAATNTPSATTRSSPESKVRRDFHAAVIAGTGASQWFRAFTGDRSRALFRSHMTAAWLSEAALHRDLAPRLRWRRPSKIIRARGAAARRSRQPTGRRTNPTATSTRPPGDRPCVARQQVAPTCNRRRRRCRTGRAIGMITCGIPAAMPCETSRCRRGSRKLHIGSSRFSGT